MLVFDTSLLCGDEISTGLDTASTVDILSILSYITRLFHRVTVVSLLQPSPEAVALFDEIILLGEGGTVLFNGPTEDARDYFVKLGYVQPDGMDDADYLLAVASSDRHLLYRPNESSDEMEEINTTQKLGERFSESPHSQQIKSIQDMKWGVDWSNSDMKSVGAFAKKYQNSFARSVWLNFKRAFTLWTRDKIFIRASVIKNIAMGLTVGAVFFDTDLNSSYFGVLFQGNLFIMLGAMASAPEKINDRVIFYKHDDSNFYPAAAYVIGQSLALIPQMVIDVLLFGTLVYFMVGFAAGGFLLYLVLFISFNYCMGSFFGLLAAVGPNKAVVGAGGALLLLLNTLFCGFIVAPTVIPPYYIWIYWMMPLSWVYRALLLNEYTSENFADGSGEEILETYGFMHQGEPFTREWIGYCFAYIVPFTFVCMFLSAVCLHCYRVEPKKSKPNIPESIEMDKEDKTAASLAESSKFVPVTLTFSNLSYSVKSSVGGEEIKLLNSVSGIFAPGRMCACKLLIVCRRFCWSL
jgi:ABC-type multidrug transport system permease subunit